MWTAANRLAAVILAGAIALPASGSAVGDASYSLASHKGMSVPAVSPYERVMSVYRASGERSAMLDRLRAKYPTLIW